MVGSAPSRFSAWGGRRGGFLGFGAGMATMAAAWTDGGGSGGGANNGRGNGAAFLGRSLACSCDNKLAARWTTVPWHRQPSLAHWHDVKLAAGWTTVPCHCWQSLACWHDNESVVGWTTMPRHCWLFPRLLVWRRRWGADTGGLLLRRRQWRADKSASALLCNGGGGKADNRASG